MVMSWDVEQVDLDIDRAEVLPTGCPPWDEEYDPVPDPVLPRHPHRASRSITCAECGMEYLQADGHPSGRSGRR